MAVIIFFLEKDGNRDFFIHSTSDSNILHSPNSCKHLSTIEISLASMYDEIIRVTHINHNPGKKVLLLEPT